MILSSSVDPAELQAWFAQAILHRDRLASDSLLDSLVPGGSLSADAAVEVYRGGYYARLRAQLEETYEAVCWWLGDSLFSELSRVFIADHGSSSYNLSDYGAAFPDFLASRQDVEQASFVEVLARFELGFAKLFHCAQHLHLDQQALSAIADPAELRFRFGAAVFFSEQDFPVYQIWSQRKQPRASAPSEIVGIEGGERVMLFKRGGEIFAERFDPVSFDALTYLSTGQALGKVMVALADRHPEVDEAVVGTLFEKIFRTGVVAELLG